MAFDSQPVDFDYFLQRKYALLQQQADAGSQNANSGAVQAATGAIVGKAAAGLDNTRANLLPAESASQIGLQAAQTALTRNQSSVVVPVAQAQIRNTDANTGLTTTQDKALTYDALTTHRLAQPGGALAGTLGAGGYSGFRLGPDTQLSTASTPTEQQPGESHLDWVARLRSAGYGR